MFFLSTSYADASITATAATPTPATVATSGTATIAVTVDIVGAPSASAPYAWRAIAYRIDKTDGASICANIPEHTTPGTYTESITAQVPAAAGTYNIYITAYANKDCFNAPAPAITRTVIFTNALVAQAVTPVSVSSVSVNSKVYDGTASAGATTACVLVGSPTGVSCSGVGTFADKNVGTSKQVTVSGITLAGPNAAQYALTTTTATTTASITKKALTATADAATRVYGQANPALTATLAGFVAGEDAASAGVSGSAVCTTTATPTTAVGAAPITCTVGTLAAQNYTVSTFVPGTLAITPAAQSITFPPLSRRTFGDAPQTLAALASSGLAVAYDSRTPSVCTVTGSTVAPVGVGVCTIRAQQAGGTNYLAAASVEQSFSVAPASTTTTVSCPVSVFYTGAMQTPCTATTTGPGLVQSVPVQYATNMHAGTAIAAAAFSGSATYTASSASATFSIVPVPVTLTIDNGTKVYGAADGAMTYSLSPSLYPGDSITGTPVRAAGEQAGDYTIHAGTLALSSDYALRVVPGTFTITPRAQTITFASPSDMVYDTADQQLVATSDAGLLVTFTTDTPDVCTVASDHIHIVHAGDCRIVAIQPGDTNHLAAASVAHTITVARASTTTTLTCPVSRLYTGTALTPCSADVHGGGSAAVARVLYTDNVHVGTAGVSAVYDGDVDHEASSATATVSIVRAGQTLTFVNPGDMVYGGNQTVSATSDAGLLVRITTTTPGICTVSGDVVHALHAGTCTLRAEQDGTADVAVAHSIERSIPIAKKDIHVVPGENQTKLVTKPEPTLSYATQEALVDGDVFTGTLGRVAGEAVGTYPYTLGTLDAGGDYRLLLDETDLFTITPDVTAPTIAPHEDVVAEATSPAGVVVTYSAPTATDDVDPTAPAVCVPNSGAAFPLGDTLVTCTAVDTAHNAATPTTFSVSVRDTVRPQLSLVGESAVTVVTPGTFSDPGSEWVDAVDGRGAVVGTGTVDVTVPGVYTLVYTYTDAAGNAAEPLVRTVTVNDGEAPLMTNVPSDIHKEADSGSGAAVPFIVPTATDAVDGDMSVLCTHASGEMFPLGTTVVACTATDTAGHTAHASWQVVVRDTTAPTLTLLGDASVTLDVGSDYTEAGASWSDAVDGTGVAEVSGVVDTTHPGEYMRQYIYTDAAGNAAEPLTRTVRVVDRVPPVISVVPSDKEVEATHAGGAVVTYTLPVAHDAVDGDVVVACSSGSGSVFALGTTTVTCTTSDAAQNSASASFSMTVRDTTKPLLTRTGPATVELYVGDAYSDAGATWSDAVDGVGSAVPSTMPDTARSGTTTITYTYVDKAGNVGEVATRTVIVRERPGGGGVVGTTYTFSSPSTFSSSTSASASTLQTTPTTTLATTTTIPSATTTQVPSAAPAASPQPQVTTPQTEPVQEQPAGPPQAPAVVASSAPAPLPGVVLGAAVSPAATAPEPYISADTMTQQAAAGVSIPTSWSLSALATVLLAISIGAFVKSFEKPSTS